MPISCQNMVDIGRVDKKIWWFFFLLKSISKLRNGHGGMLIQVHIFTFSSHWSLSSRVSLSLIQQKIYNIKTSTYKVSTGTCLHLNNLRLKASKVTANSGKVMYVDIWEFCSHRHTSLWPKKCQRKTTLCRHVNVFQWTLQP